MPTQYQLLITLNREFCTDGPIQQEGGQVTETRLVCLRRSCALDSDDGEWHYAIERA